jgi:hypothetical protein
MEMTQDLIKAHRESQIISWAMIAGLAIYAGVVEFFIHQNTPFAGFAPDLVKDFKDYFILGGLLAFILIRTARGAILRRDPNQSLTIEVLLGKLKSANIVVYAIAELPVILGLVLFMLTGNRQDFYALGTFSLLAMVLYYPKLDHWKAWLQRRS